MSTRFSLTLHTGFLYWREIHNIFIYNYIVNLSVGRDSILYFPSCVVLCDSQLKYINYTQPTLTHSLSTHSLNDTLRFTRHLGFSKVDRALLLPIKSKTLAEDVFRDWSWLKWLEFGGYGILDMLVWLAPPFCYCCAGERINQRTDETNNDD